MVERLATGVIVVALLIIAGYVVVNARYPRDEGITSNPQCAFATADYVVLIAIVVAVMAGILIAPIYP